MKKPLGFSLLELLVAVTVLAVLAAIAFPNYQTLVKNNRRTAQLNDLVSALNLARSEAVANGNNVEVCASIDQSTCSGVGPPTPWHNGYVVRDTFTSGVVQVYEASANTNTFRGNQTRFDYRPTGFLVGGGNGTVVVCDSRGNADAKGVVVSNTGRPRVEEYTTANPPPVLISCP